MLTSNIDAVLVSDARTEALRNITQQAIDSIGSQVNVIIVESNSAVTYPGATVIYPDIPFNYNAYLNLGARAGSGAYIFFGNNDLVFTPGWETRLVEAMRKHNVSSASPMCPTSHALFNIRPGSGVVFGRKVFQHFCGWAFMWERKLFEELGGLNEDFAFWCSDNVTVHQLTSRAKMHILVTGSVVHHVGKGSNTSNLLDCGTTYQYTVEELHKFNRKYQTNLKVDGTWQLPKNFTAQKPVKPEPDAGPAAREHCLFVTFDDRFGDYAKACLNSLAANYPDHPPILAYYPGKDPALLAFLGGVARLELLTDRVDLSPFEALDAGPVQSSMVFARYLLWTDAFDRYDDVLYLDVDTIILQPFGELFGAGEFFASHDNNNKKVFLPRAFHRGKALANLLAEDGIAQPAVLNDSMLNAGVFLIPRKYRSKPYYTQLLDISRRYDGFLAYADQSAISVWCYLNGIGISRDYRYNFLTHFIFNDTLQTHKPEDIKILHFSYFKPTEPAFAQLATGSQFVLSALGQYNRYAGGDQRYDVPALSIILSVKIESADRLNNLGILLDYFKAYFRNYEIIIVEEGPAPRVTPLLTDREGVVHHFVESTGSHYKTRNLNLGLSLSARPLVMMIDVDIICRPETIMRALERLGGEACFVSPHNGVTVQVAKKLFPPHQSMDELLKSLRYFPKNHEQHSQTHADTTEQYVMYGNSTYDTTGGCILFRRRECVLMGGWNTNFVSYGFEDVEFVERIHKFGYRYEKMEGANLYHLEHERFEDSMYNNFYRANEKEYRKVRAMPLEALRKYVANGYKEVVLDLRHEVRTTNTAGKYSIEIIKSEKIDLAESSIIVSGDVGSPQELMGLGVYLAYLEEFYNGYEVIIVDQQKKSRFEKMPNYKGIKYYCNVNNNDCLDEAGIIDFAAAKTNRKYLLHWDYRALVDPGLIKDKLDALTGGADALEIPNPGNYVYRGVKGSMTKGIKVLRNALAAQLV